MNSSNVLTSAPSGSEGAEAPLGIGKRGLIETYLACPACHAGLLPAPDVVACTACARTYPIVDDVILLVPGSEDEFARTLRARYEASTGGTSLPAVFRITRRLLGDLQSLAVLDVGCSQGQFAAEHLLPAGAKVVIGVDFSVAAVREAQRRFARFPNALFVVGDAMSLPIQGDRFDRVVITEVIEHLPDVSRCLAELRRVVTPDGEIVLSTPNYFNPVGLFKLLFDRLHHGGRERWTYADHSEELEHFQTPFSVRRQFEDAGLAVREFRGSDLWMGVRKALMVPWLVFDHGLRRVLNLWQRDIMSGTLAKYFGVVQYYRLRK